MARRRRSACPVCDGRLMQIGCELHLARRADAARGMRRCAVPRRALSSVARSAPKPRVLLLAGPTGVGKSRLAVDLAKRLNGEIVRCDRSPYAHTAR